MVKPVPPGTAVGIGEDEDFKFRRELYDDHAQVVHFLAGVGRVPRDDHVSFHPRSLGYPLDDAARGIRARSENKKNFIILTLKFRKRQKIEFESRLHAFARAKHG